MGREVRMVPADWVHPKNYHGYLIPLHDRFSYNAEEVIEGLRDGWLNKYMPNYGIAVMPQFPPGSCTHYQMYETCTEGTPISPVMDSPEALAHWLADNAASAFGSMTATYDHWLTMIKSGSSISMAFENGKIISGVELEADIASTRAQSADRLKKIFGSFPSLPEYEKHDAFAAGRVHQSRLDREAVEKIRVGKDLLRIETKDDALDALDEAAKGE